MRERKCFVLMLFVVFALAASTQANLLSNGGFETGDLGSWWVYESDDPNQSYSVAGEAAYSGSYGISLDTASDSTFQLGQSIDMSGGTTPEISLMYKAAYSGSWAGAGVTINYYDSNWNYLDYSYAEIQSSSEEGPANWTSLSIDSFDSGVQLTPDDTEHIDFRIDQWGWGNQYYDDVTLVPEPATIILLGLGGLTLIRKRR